MTHPLLPPHRDHLPPRRALLRVAAASSLGLGWPAHAHDFRAGEVVIDHPYALPTTPGISLGAVYFRGIRNRGATADRLVAATTPRARKVEIHETRMEGDVARMREVGAIDLPAKTTVALTHGQPLHLMLIDLTEPLVDGERFDLTLTFERGGEARVKVWVQQARPSRRDKAVSGQSGSHHH